MVNLRFCVSQRSQKREGSPGRPPYSRVDFIKLELLFHGPRREQDSVLAGRGDSSQCREQTRIGDTPPSVFVLLRKLSIPKQRQDCWRWRKNCANWAVKAAKTAESNRQLRCRLGGKLSRTCAAFSDNRCQKIASSRNCCRASSPRSFSATSQHSLARSLYRSNDLMARTLRPSRSTIR